MSKAAETYGYLPPIHDPDDGSDPATCTGIARAFAYADENWNKQGRFTLGGVTDALVHSAGFVEDWGGQGAGKNAVSEFVFEAIRWFNNRSRHTKPAECAAEDYSARDADLEHTKPPTLIALEHLVTPAADEGRKAFAQAVVIRQRHTFGNARLHFIQQVLAAWAVVSHDTGTTSELLLAMSSNDYRLKCSAWRMVKCAVAIDARRALGCLKASGATAKLLRDLSSHMILTGDSYSVSLIASLHGWSPETCRNCLLGLDCPPKKSEKLVNRLLDRSSMTAEDVCGWIRKSNCSVRIVPAMAEWCLADGADEKNLGDSVVAALAEEIVAGELRILPVIPGWHRAGVLQLKLGGAKSVAGLLRSVGRSPEDLYFAAVGGSFCTTASVGGYRRVPTDDLLKTGVSLVRVVRAVDAIWRNSPTLRGLHPGLSEAAGDALPAYYIQACRAFRASPDQIAAAMCLAYHEKTGRLPRSEHAHPWTKYRLGAWLYRAQEWGGIEVPQRVEWLEGLCPEPLAVPTDARIWNRDFDPNQAAS